MDDVARELWWSVGGGIDLSFDDARDFEREEFRKLARESAVALRPHLARLLVEQKGGEEKVKEDIAWTVFGAGVPTLAEAKQGAEIIFRSLMEDTPDAG